MTGNRFVLTLIAIALAATFSSSAYGYIDGGTGSMLLQAGISGVLGAIFLARSFFRDLPSRFRKKHEAIQIDLEQEERKAA